MGETIFSGNVGAAATLDLSDAHGLTSFLVANVHAARQGEARGAHSLHAVGVDAVAATMNSVQVEHVGCAVGSAAGMAVGSAVGCGGLSGWLSSGQLRSANHVSRQGAWRSRSQDCVSM